MSKKRVVVTGSGVVSCLGCDVNEFYQNLLDGKSGIKTITSLDLEGYPTQFGGKIEDFDIGDYLDKKQARRVDQCIRYAAVAGKKAVESAGVDLAKVDLERCGMVIGSGMGGMETYSNGVNTHTSRGWSKLSPFFIAYTLTNSSGGLLAIDLGFKGPNYSVSTACATGNYSIHLAAKHIRDGEADMMLAGGTEAAMIETGIAGFSVMKALSRRNAEPEKASRPWDQERDGFVMGEGAGVLMLESLDHALARGANILCEYMGGAFSCDAFHITAPHPEGDGQMRCLKQAIEDAGIEKERVNYINAHATSTPVGDLCEIKGIRRFFGDEHVEKNVKINATKSLIGHALGAAGGIEAVAVVKAIETGKLHPTLNCDNPDELLSGIDIVKDKAIEHQVDVAASNSFGFGGHNSVLLFAPYKG